EQVFRDVPPGAALDRGGGGGRSIGDIAVDAPGGFRLIPGSARVARMADPPAPDPDRLIDAIPDLEHAADVVIIDTAAGVGPSVLDFLYAADLALVVATPEPTAIADAYALIKCLHAGRLDAGARRDHAAQPAVALVVNQADPREAAAVHARIA